MDRATNPCHKPRHEHSIPFFWPLAAAVELEAAGMELLRRNLAFAAEASAIAAAPAPDWATPNDVLLDLETMKARDFSQDRAASGWPVLIDPPYAGHSSTIADYAKGQSLVETLQAKGLARIFVADWKPAGQEMKYLSIDSYLAEINALVDDLGGRVLLVGLCQGGWMSSMYAARYPDKVRGLVLAGAPIDTKAGNGPLKHIVSDLPRSFYADLVAGGGGLMRGQAMLAGWKNMHPGEQYFGKFLDLYEHVEDPAYLARTRQFESWYEHAIDLPGRYYLEAIDKLFRDNQLARGAFVGLGRRLDLKDIKCPLYLLAGATDDITPKEQVFAAAELMGTSREQIAQRLAPGGHIGLFMGKRTLADIWPSIGEWLIARGAASLASGKA